MAQTGKQQNRERIYGSAPNRVCLKLREDGKVWIGAEGSGTGSVLSRDNAYKLSRGIVEVLNAKD